MANRALSPSPFAFLVLLALGCGDDTGSATATGTGESSGASSNDPTTNPDTMSASGTMSAEGSGSSGESATADTTSALTAPMTESATTTDPTSSTDPTTTDPTTVTDTDASSSGPSSTDPSASTSSSEGGSSSESGEETTGGVVCKPGGPGVIDFSYIWVANSPQGTVSKIDTQTATEVARYTSGPNGATDPSRTSVSANGRFAVVANRNGGLTMIAAEEADCVDNNNNGMIDTSAGPNDVLAWDSDECVLWNIALPASSNQGPRPVSWTIGEQDPVTCEYDAGDVWIGWYQQGLDTGTFRLVDGMTGATLDEIDVPNWSGMNWGPYGGAIDYNNDFWAVGWGDNGPVVRIDGVTHVATHYGNPGGWIYGMGLDLQGNTWATGCGNGNVYRFEAATETWSQVASVPNASCLRGLQVDLDGVAWIARNGGCGLAAIDTTVEPPVAIDLAIPIAGCSTPVGVSIDAEGYVWVVDQGASAAFKIDPDTYQIVSTVNGLVSPYTYSDMTGAGINAQIVPQ